MIKISIYLSLGITEKYQHTYIHFCFKFTLVRCLQNKRSIHISLNQKQASSLGSFALFLLASMVALVLKFDFLPFIMWDINRQFVDFFTEHVLGVKTVLPAV